MSDGRESDRRSFTESEMEEILARQRKADISAQRTAVLHGMELKLAELIGTDGDGGDFQHMREKVSGMAVTIAQVILRVEKQELFTNRAKWTIAIGATLGGSLAGFAMWLVDRLLK